VDRTIILTRIYRKCFQDAIRVQLSLESIQWWNPFFRDIRPLGFGARNEFFLLERPNLFAILHSTNGGKGEGWHVEEYSVALLS
jgi:hypothetical protein